MFSVPAQPEKIPDLQIFFIFYSSKNPSKFNVKNPQNNVLLVVILKIGTPGVHVSTARESDMCYSFGTSVGDVTRLNVANVVRFSLYIWLIWKFLIKGRALPLP